MIAILANFLELDKVQLFENIDLDERFKKASWWANNFASTKPIIPTECLALVVYRTTTC